MPLVEKYKWTSPQQATGNYQLKTLGYGVICVDEFEKALSPKAMGFDHFLLENGQHKS